MSLGWQAAHTHTHSTPGDSSISCQGATEYICLKHLKCPFQPCQSRRRRRCCCWSPGRTHVVAVAIVEMVIVHVELVGWLAAQVADGQTNKHVRTYEQVHAAKSEAAAIKTRPRFFELLPIFLAGL